MDLLPMELGEHLEKVDITQNTALLSIILLFYSIEASSKVVKCLIKPRATFFFFERTNWKWRKRSYKTSFSFYKHIIPSHITRQSERTNQV